jgi:hypothetical protein
MLRGSVRHLSLLRSGLNSGQQPARLEGGQALLIQLISLDVLIELLNCVLPKSKGEPHEKGYLGTCASTVRHRSDRCANTNHNWFSMEAEISSDANSIPHNPTTHNPYRPVDAPSNATRYAHASGHPNTTGDAARLVQRRRSDCGRHDGFKRRTTGRLAVWDQPGN